MKTSRKDLSCSRSAFSLEMKGKRSAASSRSGRRSARAAPLLRVLLHGGGLQRNVHKHQEGLRVASNGQSLHHPLLSKEQLMWRCITLSSKAPTSKRTFIFLHQFAFRGATSLHHRLHTAPPRCTDEERRPPAETLKVSTLD